MLYAGFDSISLPFQVGKEGVPGHALSDGPVHIRPDDAAPGGGPGPLCDPLPIVLAAAVLLGDYRQAPQPAKIIRHPAHLGICGLIGVEPLAVHTGYGIE